jgi:anti-sigma factor RsiW
MNHLTDETLNEYLDEALPPAARAAAADHLADCAACAARLASLQSVVARFEILYVPALSHDLSAGVLAGIAQPKAPAPRLALRPALNWVFAAQALAALLLLVLAWPVVSSLASAWLNPGTGFVLDIREAVAEVQSWFALVADPARAVEQGWAGLRGWWLDLGATVDVSWPAAALGPVEAGLLAAAALGLWLVGNGVLLRQPISTFLRRRS